MTKRDDTKNAKLLNICILNDFMTVTLSKIFGFWLPISVSHNRYNRAIVIASRHTTLF
jgi:hypothetical protein